MEEFQILREDAQKKIKVADHMLTMSYKLVEDPKILLSVVSNTYYAVEAAMSSVLSYERIFKRVPVYSNEFDSKFNLFRSKVAPKKMVKKEHLKLIQTLRELYVAHKKSPMEFRRHEKFVIANDSYELRTLDYESVKAHVNSAKVFIKEMYKLTIQDDRIFR